MTAAPPLGELGDDEESPAAFVGEAGASQMRGCAAGVATLAVARWEGELDEDRAKAVLRGEIPYAPTPAPSAVTAEPDPTETPAPTHAPVPAAR